MTELDKKIVVGESPMMELFENSFERKHWLTAAIGLLIILSWLGSLDKYSDNYTNGAIVQAGSAYAVARGINATVSMLQTSTVSFSAGVGGSITIGEILDPVNDLIERFSEVMTVSLGSLALQKILLSIAANKLFSGLLSLIGVLSLLVVWTGKTRAYPMLLKLFIILVVVRFSLGIVVLSNGAVSHLFLTGHIEESSARLGELKEDINNLQREKEITSAERKSIENSIKQDNFELKTIHTSMSGLVGNLKDIQTKIDHAEAVKDEVKQKAGLVDRFNPLTRNQSIRAAQGSIDELAIQKGGIEKKIEKQQKRIESLDDTIKQNRAMLEGNSEGMVAKLKGLKKNLSASAIEEKVSSFVQNIIDLLMLFILILIPVMFFYLFMGLAKAAWRMDWEQLIACDKKQ